MSSANRTTSKGGKGSKAEKTNKTEKTDSGKGSEKANSNRDTNAKSEDPSIKEKVKQLMEMTERSEEEVCLALHECDNDLNKATNWLFEVMGQGEWETRVKKKKNRQASASKQDKSDENAAVEDWNDANPQSGGNNEKEKPRNKSGGPPRLHGRHNDSRGWRGREKQENERNLEDGGRPDYRERRGRPGGSTRGGGGGRGRGGGRAGGRYPPRGNRNNSSYNKPIDTWDNSNTWDNSTAVAANHNAEENWDDFPGTDEWSTEEYTGSLADTKVFTPSVQPGLDSIVEQGVAQPPPLDATAQTLQMGQPPVQIPSQSPVLNVGTLSAAQTQYLSQFTQNNDKYATNQSFQNQTYEKTNQQVYNSSAAAGAQTYNSTQQYGSPAQNSYVNSSYQAVNNTYGSGQEQVTTQPTRTKTQRARVPPPSKIPSSAVEMPGDLNSNMAYLDVQFGAMDFIDNTFDAVSDNTKYGTTNTSTLENVSTTPTSNLDLSTTNQNSSLDAYSPKTNTQSSISSALSQSLTNTDSIPQTSTEHLTSAYNTAPKSSTQGGSTVAPAGLELSKQSDTHSYSSQASTYNSYQGKTNTYNSSAYSGTQTTSSSYVPSNQTNSYVNNQSGGSYNAPSGGRLNNSSNYGNTSTSQYNSYTSSGNSHKLVKENTYDNSSSAVSSSQATTTNNVTSSSAQLSLSQTTMSSSKPTTTLAAKNSNSVVSNIPPGVAPVMSTPYIMGQVPFYQQPVYSYEEMQLLQQRLPHMTTPYYDMSYQTPTTLATVRDATLGNVGYSISDGRFTRGDNNASPVPSTLSQQTSTLTQGHQAQPILAGTAPPYFFAATAFNTLAPNYQFGTMYTQLPAATNAHGTSNSNQYPKPATYGSGYGNYDALSQTPDYNKGGYVGNTQGQKGAGGNASSTGSTGNDLSAMYAKSHTALGKVNSYDKQGFHSGTPPPFAAGALHGNQNAGLAPSGTGYAPQVYIPTMPPHQQHHSTPLMHQPLHQMDVRHQGRRVDSGNTSGQRSQSSNQNKAGTKQTYQTSYWNQA